ncbi:hypothetical protein Naga_100905g3 [Nannochloropsis gaditana]|uniref:Uncharacterized protein n=1 Tax=Nannochloropsis gaditana TaxID=72520 RepID=W7TR97_9STRA|nr:hypothetical protein Naga_100905g3 [Nannochloropsis gaditana]
MAEARDFTTTARSSQGKRKAPGGNATGEVVGREESYNTITPPSDGMKDGGDASEATCTGQPEKLVDATETVTPIFPEAGSEEAASPPTTDEEHVPIPTVLQALECMSKPDLPPQPMSTCVKELYDYIQEQDEDPRQDLYEEMMGMDAEALARRMDDLRALASELQCKEERVLEKLRNGPVFKTE